MRRLTIVLAVAALAAAACNKKKDDGDRTTGVGTAAGTAAGTATGTGAATGTAAGTAAGTATGTAAGTATGTAAGDPAGASLTNRLGNCPSAVAGATTTLVDDPAAAGKLTLAITATSEAATATIRKRAAHLVSVQGAPDAEIKHTGDGTGGATKGLCPVITTRDVKLTATDIEGGSQVVLEPQAGADLAALRKEVEERVAETAKWAQANLAGTDTSGGGGGTGGGAGDHGGNHSGKGDGTGKGDGSGPGKGDGAGGGGGGGGTGAGTATP